MARPQGAGGSKPAVLAVAVVLTLLAVLGAGPNAASTGLVAAYGFNEGTGTTVTDLSGAKNSGTVSGATWVTSGKAGGALSFNGSSSFVTVADSASLRLSGALTLEAWVRPAALGAVYRTVLVKQQTAQLVYALYASNKSTRPTVNAYVTADNEQQGTAALALNAWSFLAATYDGATLRLYVNGALAGSRALTGTLAAGTGPLRIGGNSIWGEWFSGLIDEVRIYNRALTTSELSADMATPVTAGPPDTTAPSVPAGLTQTAATPTSVTVAWNASTDDTGVVGYDVFRNGVKAATLTATTAVVSNLPCGAPATIEVAAFDAAGNVSPHSALVATTAACDTTPPQVSVTQPAVNASLSGSATLSAAASDDIGIASVQFTIDGTAAGPPITTPPYAFGWASTSVPNGSHVVAATATDTSGNSAASQGVPVVVSNTLDTTNAMKRVTVGAGYTDASVRGVVRTAGDRAYVFVADDTPQRTATGPGVIHAYRADQVGVPTSFGEADAAHRPTSTGTTHVLGAPDVRLDRSGVAHLVYVDESTHTVLYRTFSTLTDTWGAATTLGAGATYTTSSIKRSGNAALVLDNGDAPCVVYATASALMFTSLTAGVWSVPERVAAGTAPVHPQLAVDGAGVIHLAWLNASLGPGQAILYASRRTDGTWSPPETVAGADVLDNLNSDQGPSIALDPSGSPSVLYVSLPRIFTSGAYYGAVQVATRTANGWVAASPPVDALTHTPQIYMEGADVYAFLGHDTTIHIAYLYRLAGLPWTPLTQLDATSTTDGSASIRWDPARDNNPGLIDATFYDEDLNDNKGYLPAVYYIGVLPRGQQPAPTPDTTAPAVAVTSPAPGAAVGGIVTVTASASDDRAVAGVQFLLDGFPLGAVSTSPPYSASWDATGASGPHTLSATAWDAAGNRTTSAPVQITVDNSVGPPPPAFARDLGTTSIVNTGNSISLAVPSPGVVAGDSVVVWALMSGGGGVAVSSVTDARGNSFTVDSSLSNSGINAFVASARTVTSLQPGDKITVTFGGTYYSLRALAAAEFSGIGPVADAKAGATGSGTAPASGALSTTVPTALLIGGVGTTSTGTLASRSGFTALPSVSVTASGTTRTIHRMYQVAVQKSAYAGGGTLSAASPWTAALVAYR